MLGNRNITEEVKRCLEAYKLDENFLSPQINCNYLVSEKQKKIWLIELDMLYQFDLICKKYNLRYFLSYGSLLGAIRHKGFIPWDDDLDVCMPRKDYDKFVTLVDEFAPPYFLQTPSTDEGYLFSFAKLRNGNSTAISRKFAFNSFNQGIFLDVFPLDKVVLSDVEQQRQEVFDLIKQCSSYMRRDYPNLTESERMTVNNLGDFEPLKVHKKIDEICRRHQYDDCEMVSVVACTVYPLKRSIFYLDDFETVQYVDFEFLKVPIPSGFERILSTIYGHYMDYPPINERGKWHDGVFFDPDASYDNYLYRINLNAENEI